MTAERAKPRGQERWRAVLQRRDALSGLLFMGVAAFGLWISRNYPIGTASSMGTGYMPRLLLWVLLGLGGLILVSGLWKADRHQQTDASGAAAWRPVVFVTLSLVVFGLALERLGLLLSILTLPLYVPILIFGVAASVGPEAISGNRASALLILLALVPLALVIAPLAGAAALRAHLR